MTWNLHDLKPLTASQYDAVKDQSLRRIIKRIGKRPSLAEFRRDYTSLWTILDSMALIVFIAAFVVSSVHILNRMAVAIQHSLMQETIVTLGIHLDPEVYTIIHQLAFIFLAELSMLLFMVLFGMEKKAQGRKWVYLLLGMLSAVFVIAANVASGIGVIESIMPPAFTIGVGFNLERLIVATLRHRHDISKRYRTALAEWEAASKDATTHPDYVPVLRRGLWDKLASLKANQSFAEAPTWFKQQAVAREQARERWSYEHQNGSQSTAQNTPPARLVEAPETEDDVPFPQPALHLSGNGQHAG